VASRAKLNGTGNPFGSSPGPEVERCRTRTIPSVVWAANNPKGAAALLTKLHHCQGGEASSSPALKPARGPIFEGVARLRSSYRAGLPTFSGSFAQTNPQGSVKPTKTTKEDGKSGTEPGNDLLQGTKTTRRLTGPNNGAIVTRKRVSAKPFFEESRRFSHSFLVCSPHFL
jgi:hypothetical protein